MSLIILLPAIACWAVIAKWSTRRALLDVYLPVLLLLPQYYILRAPHLPPITFADAAILPLGLAFLANGMRGWRMGWMDVCVLGFAASQGISEGLSAVLQGGGSPNPLGTNLANGALMFINGLMAIVIPYIAGKLLIERPDASGTTLRRKFAGRFAMLLAIVSVISIHDFITGRNTWLAIGGFLFPTQFVFWPPQMRWGFGRIAGPFGHAILAGMVFLMGFCYCLWLSRVEPHWGGRKLIHGMPFTLRGLVLAAVSLGLFMTQSRGPWMGVGLALVFALLTRKFPLAKAGMLFLLFMACFSVVAYYVGDKYTDRDLSQADNEEQQNAIYRRELIPHYVPLVLQRPAFGWGLTTFPKIAGQTSIDNEYLLLAVTQGLPGLGLFLAILFGSAGRLFKLLGRPMARQDRLLIFAHMAVLIGLMTTLSTVYMGEQVMVLFFLFAGWVQGMNPAFVRVSAGNRFVSQGEFRRVMA